MNRTVESSDSSTQQSIESVPHYGGKRSSNGDTDETTETPDEAAGEPPTVDIDPPADLLDRYDNMVATQVETINEIDQKAATTMRIIAILLGVVLSGLTILVNAQIVTEILRSPVATVWFIAGLLLLLLSLAWAIYTYLSSRFLYGPGITWGVALAENRVPPENYADNLLIGYSQALDTNRKVVRVNSRRFRNSLIALLHGMTATSIAFGFFLLPIPQQWKLVISLGFVFIGIGITDYLISEEHLVINHDD